MKNTLWKSTHRDHAKIKAQRKPDALCKGCDNDKDCKHTCIGLKWINGNTELKEKILDQAPSIHLYQTDYKETLHELMVDRQIRDLEHLELIKSITDPRKKMIAACLMVGMTQQEISKQAHISQTRISRIYQSLK
jgi:DNA-directed RNA polymerase specialized sigma subunit